MSAKLTKQQIHNELDGIRRRLKALQDDDASHGVDELAAEVLRLVDLLLAFVDVETFKVPS